MSRRDYFVDLALKYAKDDSHGYSQKPPSGRWGPGNLMQQMIFNKLYQSNPQFRAFADSMRGQNPQQAFQERGLDYNQFQNMDINQVRRMLGM